MDAAVRLLDLLGWYAPGWGGALARGLLASLQIAVGGYAVGLLIGIGGALGKLYGGTILRDMLTAYTTIVRAVPELVLIVLLYYAGTDLLNRAIAVFGGKSVDISGLLAGIFVIAVVQGAYMVEVLRGAILTVKPGLIEAAHSLGLSRFTTIRRVVLPIMLPDALPGLSNLWLVATKNTALLAVVGFSELTLVTRQAAGSTKEYFFFFTVAGLIYLTVTMVSNAAIRLLEKRVGRWRVAR